jgi:catechol 2,3-dioxygenase-like lactoylglutathione lyase family enzyme
VPDALRVARHTARLAGVVVFYRDGLGLTEVGGFRDHDGYDGVFLELPGTAAHLEFTAGGGHCASAPHPESLLVLYLGDAAAVEAVVARLDADPVPPANPYWAEHGVTFEDPDGFRVVLVPERWGGERAGEVRVAEHAGLRAELRRLFELAEDSEQELGAYIDDGRVFVAIDGDQVVGHLQITDTGEPGEAEVNGRAAEWAQAGPIAALRSACSASSPAHLRRSTSWATKWASSSCTVIKRSARNTASLPFAVSATTMMFGIDPAPVLS